MRTHPSPIFLKEFTRLIVDKCENTVGIGLTYCTRSLRFDYQARLKM